MLDLIKRSLGFAAIAHKGQYRRDSRIPYISHCIKVGEIVESYADINYDYVDICAAAYLHDTLEDTKTTYDVLVEEFNHKVANLVVELTNTPEQEQLKGNDKDIMLIEKMKGMSEHAVLIKFADRFDNVMDSLYRKNYLRRSLCIVETVLDSRVWTYNPAKVLGLELISKIEDNL